MPAGRRGGRSGGGPAGESVATHSADTTAVHGIADTSQVALKNAAQTFTEDQTIAAGKKLFFASDTSLERSSADNLWTDDSFNINAYLNTLHSVAVGVLGDDNARVWFGVALDTSLVRTAAATLTTESNFRVGTVGKGLRVAEGANAKQGVSTLVAGTVTVSNTSVTASSRIFLTSNADGGTPGWLRVSARTAATSFTITSSSGTDTSTVAWLILEPA